MAQTYEDLIRADNGFIYGCEWKSDAVDKTVDQILRSRYSLLPSRSNFSRAALEVGCYTGWRAAALANLNVFDRIIACDINDCSKWVAKRSRDCEIPVDFRRSSVLDLSASLFPGLEIVYINFRRVGHFLPFPQFCEAVAILKDILCDGGLMTISFDKKCADKVDTHPLLAPYYQHEPEEVQSFVTSLGFTTRTVNGEGIDFCEDEHNILAFAPTRRNGSSSRIAALPSDQMAYA